MSKPVATETCLLCRFYVGNTQAGTCFRYPPKTFGSTFDRPPVKATDRACGEFQGVK